MAKRKLKKQVKRKFRKTLKRVDKVKKLSEQEDTFLNEDSPVIVEDAFVSQPSRDEVREVLSDLDGYRDWQRESRGNGLTYGDY